MYNIFETYSEFDGEFFLKKQISEKIIFENPHRPKFCDFLFDFGNQNRPKNHKISVNEDLQK